MKEIILIKDGELALKGLNRKNFEHILIANLKRKLRDLGAVKIENLQSTITIEPLAEDFDFEEALERVKLIFGIAAFSRACVCEKNIEDIYAKAPDYLKETMENIRSFKVEAKRSDKSFPMTSPEICREVGGLLLNRYPHLKVDVHNPDVIV
ncbi:MAG: tRNA 4-thiouridine(8) synthase ThiI, partial [Clostridia bacterium]|nr:tRNA 4-thiouridine(8) synthase ThiI [Clostridia bacterium]